MYSILASTGFLSHTPNLHGRRNIAAMPESQVRSYVSALLTRKWLPKAHMFLYLEARCDGGDDNQMTSSNGLSVELSAYSRATSAWSHSRNGCASINSSQKGRPCQFCLCKFRRLKSCLAWACLLQKVSYRLEHETRKVNSYISITSVLLNAAASATVELLIF